MKLNRRELVAGAAALAASIGSAQAQAAEEIVVGAVFPMSGSTAQTGVDARNAIETALAIINEKQDLDLPLAKDAGLPGLGGKKVKVVWPTTRAIRRRGERKPSA